MGFGDSVHELLETFSKCLTLLGALNSSNAGEVALSSPTTSDVDGRSVLSRNLRADRAKVHRAYSSRLSQTGGKLDNGDERARSTLRRIIDRLVSALTGLLSSDRSSSSSSYNGRLDYNALRALSNASRVDAIHAIDELSMRVGSQQHNRRRVHSRTSSRTPSHASHSSRASRTFSRTGSSASSSTGSSTGSATTLLTKQRRHQHHSRHHRPSDHQHGQSRPGNTEATSKAHQSAPTRRQQSGKPSTATAPQHDSRKQTSTPEPSRRRRPTGGNDNDYYAKDKRQAGTEQDAKRYKHISISSSSSGSTKLGEIPERKLRRRINNQPGQDSTAEEQGYNVRPVYPVRPFVQAPVEDKSSKKGFWGKFR